MTSVLGMEETLLFISTLNDWLVEMLNNGGRGGENICVPISSNNISLTKEFVMKNVINFCFDHQYIGGTVFAIIFTTMAILA